jgi:hypothetical protein
VRKWGLSIVIMLAQEVMGRELVEREKLKIPRLKVNCWIKVPKEQEKM